MTPIEKVLHDQIGNTISFLSDAGVIHEGIMHEAFVEVIQGEEGYTIRSRQIPDGPKFHNIGVQQIFQNKLFLIPNTRVML